MFGRRGGARYLVVFVTTDIVSKTLLSRGDDYGASSNLAVRRSSSGSASGGGDCGNGGSGDVGVEANVNGVAWICHICSGGGAEG